MTQIVVGLAFTLAASALYAVGLALQAVEARNEPEQRALRFGLFRRLVRRPRWLLGTGCGLAGWALQALALTHASLTLVQPALAFGLVFVVLIASRRLDETIGRRELLAVGAIITAVPLIAWLAPERTVALAHGPRLWIPLVAIAVAALVPYAFRGDRRAASALVPVSAGLAYALDGLATKLASDDYSVHRWLSVAAWFVAMNLASAVGTLSEMSALQRRPVSHVAPLVFGLTTFVPVALAPLLVGENWSSSPQRDAGVAFGLLLVAAGALTLALSKPFARVLAVDTPSPDRETPRNPRSDSVRASDSAPAESPTASALTTMSAPGASDARTSAT